MPEAPRQEIPALKLHQWLPEWDEVPFPEVGRRRKPDPYFYLFALSATQLRSLSGVYRRRADGPRAQDAGIQRAHVPEGTVKLSLLGADGGPKVGNDRRIGDRIRPVQALATARTGSVWGCFVQSKLNVTVPFLNHGDQGRRRLLDRGQVARQDRAIGGPGRDIGK